MRAAAPVVVLALLTGAGCRLSAPLPPLPVDPAGGPAAEPEPPAAEGTRESDPLAPAVHGEEILPGVRVLDPVREDGTGAASFRIANGSGAPLPDLILAVVFAVPGPDGASRPIYEVVEAPLGTGETRRFHVLPAAATGAVPTSFRIAAGLPSLLAARAGQDAGTTFLSGRLECVRLEADLTAAEPTVTVGLADRDGGPGEGDLEARLLCVRAGEILWAGAWVRVPRSGGTEGEPRLLRWRIDGAPGLAGCDLFLRVRGKR